MSSALRRLVPYLGWVIYKLLYMTWRIEVREPESLKQRRINGEACVFAHWHGDELAILHLLKPYKVCAMVSTSKDGELMDRVVHLLGGKTSRGSSTRGGVNAVRGILRLVKAGLRPSVAVDGPKGPIYKVKPGVFEIAKLTQLPIYPMGISVTRCFRFERSWNKTYLPLFFSKVVIVFGDELAPPGREADVHDQALLSSLELALTTARADAQTEVERSA